MHRTELLTLGVYEGVCDGKKSRKPWRTPGGPKKFAVCVDGKLVRFGDPELEIKRDSDKRRKSFRARHGCGKRPNTKDPGKAGYWSCKTWEKNRTVADVVEHRSKLLVLEKAGLVQEISDCGAYYRSSASLDQFPTSGDPIADERLRLHLEKRRREAEIGRLRRMERMRRLARLDLRLVGGVAPIGAFGGSGGTEPVYRPASISPRL